MDCIFCGLPHMEWRMDENVSKSRIWDTNMNFWHDCKESPDAKKKKQNEEFAKQRQKELLEQRKFKAAKLKTPIYCVECEGSVKPYEPCKHMIRDGFEVGKDGSDFYSDSFKARERREQLKAKKKKTSLDSFK